MEPFENWSRAIQKNQKMGCEQRNIVQQSIKKRDQKDQKPAKKQKFDLVFLNRVVFLKLSFIDSQFGINKWVTECFSLLSWSLSCFERLCILFDERLF